MVTPGFGLAACTRGYAYFDRFAVRGGDGVGMAIGFGLAGCLQKKLEKVGRVRAAISFDPFGVRERFGGMVTPGFGLAACTRGYAYLTASRSGGTGSGW